jgi:hypothetical protein
MRMQHRKADVMRTLWQSVLALAFVLLLAAACTTYPANEHGEISMDDWCDQDASLPWTGCWEEIGQIECDTGETFEAEDAIGELRLRADGGYSVTRHPFEHFVDFAGTYTVTQSASNAKRTIRFSPIDTPNFHGEGTLHSTETGDLFMTGVWFGVFESADGDDSDAAVIPCGYLFEPK